MDALLCRLIQRADCRFAGAALDAADVASVDERVFDAADAAWLSSAEETLSVEQVTYFRTCAALAVRREIVTTHQVRARVRVCV